MSNITLVPGGKNKRGAYANQSVILPMVGEVTFAEDGSLSVPQAKALPLIEATKESFDFYVRERKADDQPKPEGKVVQLPGEQAGEQPAANQSSPADASSEQAGEVADNAQPEAQLSEEDQAKLAELSAAAESRRQIAEDLEKTDLKGLLTVAKEFPDLTPEKLTGMTDAKIRQTLLDRLLKA